MFDVIFDLPYSYGQYLKKGIGPLFILIIIVMFICARRADDPSKRSKYAMIAWGVLLGMLASKYFSPHNTTASPENSHYSMMVEKGLEDRERERKLQKEITRSEALEANK